VLRERAEMIHKGLLVIDGLLIICGFVLSYYLRTRFHGFFYFDFHEEIYKLRPPVEFVYYLPGLIVVLPIWLGFLSFFDLYKSLRIYSIFNVLFRVVKATFFCALIIANIVFLSNYQIISRVFLIFFFFISMSLILIEKFLIYEVAHLVRRKGYNFRSILIVGTGKRVGHFIDQLAFNPQWGLKVEGLIDTDNSLLGKEFYGYPVVGVLSDLPKILEDQVIDEVVFIVPRSWLPRIQDSIHVCEVVGVQAVVAVDLFNLNIARAKQSDLNGLPFLSFETTFLSGWNKVLKRLIDTVFSFIALVCLFPLMLFIAIMIKITTPGPIFYRQKRVSLNGRVFTMFKFRSMFVDAEKRLEELKEKNEMTGPVFKLKNDPRITPIGKFIRRTSIDELPQLFNVLKGDMSLVGPRPPLPDEVKKYETWQRRRLSMRPGITCVWQVSGRNNIDFDEWMELDLYYIDNWSLWLDFKILLQTIPAVLLAKGAK